MNAYATGKGVIHQSWKVGSQSLTKNLDANDWAGNAPFVRHDDGLMDLRRTCKLTDAYSCIVLIFGSRIEALEAKVNQLLDAKSASPEPSSLTDEVEQMPYARAAASDSTGSSVSGAAQADAGHGSLRPLPTTQNAALDVIDAGLLSLGTANLLLNIYKTSMVYHFPFVVVAPLTTVEDLRTEKPFLLLAILTASSFDDMPLQRALGKELKHVVSSRMILGGQVSFDLLQGLLVHLAWYVWNC